MFELTALMPPDPALKYRMVFDPAECTSGNAATIYQHAADLLTPDMANAIDRALDEMRNGDSKTFADLADKAIDASRPILDQLDAAGRCDQCDWQISYRYRDVQAGIPRLRKFREMASLLRVTAARQIRQGNLQEAQHTLKIGYELARKLGQQPLLIPSLVAVGITARMNDAAAELMNQPQSPNLYWALATLPRVKPNLRSALESEQRMLAALVPQLTKVRRGEDVSGDDWATAMGEVCFLKTRKLSTQPARIPLTGPALLSLPQARAYYAKSRGLAPDEVAKLDPAKVIGNYFFEQYQRASDETSKLVELPYAVMIPKMVEVETRTMYLRAGSRFNPFLSAVASTSPAVKDFARADRQIALLTAVEALRSYAAANHNQLPAQLADVTDTPVPENPATGKPFEYKLAGTDATIADTQNEVPISYVVRIRK